MANPFVWQMVKEAVEQLGGKATNGEIKKYIKDKYSAVNDTTINCTILICSVNKQSRINWPENSKPRSSNSQYDFLFNTGRGQVELYSPHKHGDWEIRQENDGRLMVCQVGLLSDNISKKPAMVGDGLENNINEDNMFFPWETHLRDFIAKNISSMNVDGKNLRLYVDNDGVEGIEYQTEVGRIDILAVDDNDNYIILELKLSKGIDSALGQLLRYMGWIKAKLSAGKQVKGVIVAANIDDKLKYAASMVQDVTLYKYEVNFSLQKESLAN
ncbi:MAG: endonuclease NucS domain-containing protein [Bacillota bacterium]